MALTFLNGIKKNMTQIFMFWSQIWIQSEKLNMKHFTSRCGIFVKKSTLESVTVPAHMHFFSISFFKLSLCKVLAWSLNLAHFFTITLVNSSAYYITKFLLLSLQSGSGMSFIIFIIRKSVGHKISPWHINIMTENYFNASFTNNLPTSMTSLY